MKFVKFSVIIMTISISIFTISVMVYFSLSQTQVIYASPTTEIQSNIINLAISNITIEKSVTGLTSVEGILFNNSTENVENIQVDVMLYDSNNNTIRETSRFVTSAFYVFEPGATVDFNFLMSIEDFSYYNARAYADRVQ